MPAYILHTCIETSFAESFTWIILCPWHICKYRCKRKAGVAIHHLRPPDGGNRNKRENEFVDTKRRSLACTSGDSLSPGYGLSLCRVTFWIAQSHPYGESTLMNRPACGSNRKYAAPDMPTITISRLTLLVPSRDFGFGDCHCV